MGKNLTSLEIKDLFRENGIVLQDGEARVVRYAATAFYLRNVRGENASHIDVKKYENYKHRMKVLSESKRNFPIYKVDPCLIFQFSDGEMAIL